MLTWKIVVSAETSVLYIYIDEVPPLPSTCRVDITWGRCLSHLLHPLSFEVKISGRQGDGHCFYGHSTINVSMLVAELHLMWREWLVNLVSVWIAHLRVHVFSFCVFFFFFSPTAVVDQVFVHCLQTHKLYFSVTFSLKMDFTVLFTYLKIILI